MEKADIGDIKQLLDEQSKQLRDHLEVRFKEQTRDMHDFTRQDIAASEQRLEKRILEGVAEIIDGSINPQIEDHETRIDKLEKKVFVST